VQIVIKSAGYVIAIQILLIFVPLRGGKHVRHRRLIPMPNMLIKATSSDLIGGKKRFLKKLSYWLPLIAYS
jgi:hypothetical protein